MKRSGHGARTGNAAVTNPNRDAKGRYATWWFGLASFAALLLLMFFAVSSVMGYGK
jgi:hypothetical protein